MELYQRIEHLLGKKLPLYPSVEEEVLLLGERVGEALRLAKTELKELEEKKEARGGSGGTTRTRMPASGSQTGSAGAKRGGSREGRISNRTRRSG